MQRDKENDKTQQESGLLYFHFILLAVAGFIFKLRETVRWVLQLPPKSSSTLKQTSSFVCLLVVFPNQKDACYHLQSRNFVYINGGWAQGPEQCS